MTGWLEALEHRLAASDLASATKGVHLAVQVTITGDPDGEITYVVRLADGRLSVVPAAGPHDVSITFDHETAAAIQRGESTAQEAFMAGRAKVGGDARRLLEHADVLAAIRFG